MNKTHYKTRVLLFFSLCVFCLGMANSAYAIAENNAEVVYSLGDKEITEVRRFPLDKAADLLTNEEGTNLEEQNADGSLYKLKEVKVTRHRQKLKINYFLGDYNSSSKLGEDSGYADYDDYVSDYILTIAQISEKYNVQLGKDYVLVDYDSTSNPYLVPEYSGNDDTIEVNILVAKTKRYQMQVKYYQNKQNVKDPNPVGKTGAEIETLTDYWRVYYANGTIDAIEGQTINFKFSCAINNSYVKGGRNGQLKYCGYYDDQLQKFVNSPEYEVKSSTPDIIQIGAFYQVDDYDQANLNPTNPGTTSGALSNATIGLYASGRPWKSESTSEILKLDVLKNYEKLKEYPFHLGKDSFDIPDPELDEELEENWMLGHRISVTYYYQKEAEQPGGTDKPQTGDSNPDKPQTDDSNSDKPQTDDSNSDKPQIDNSNPDKPQTDDSNSDKPQTDDSNSDKPRTDNSKTENSQADGKKNNEKTAVPQTGDTGSGKWFFFFIAGALVTARQIKRKRSTNS